MISLQKSLSEFDKIRGLERASIECYYAAIQSAEQYLVEVEAPDARETRKQLHEVLSTAEQCHAPEPLLETRGRLRAVLRDYQDRAQKQIGRLRGDLQSALAAMQDFADSIQSQGGDHQGQIVRELDRLKKTVATSEDIVEIRAGVVAAAQGIEACVEKMQRESQVVIAQLSDEIRVLQERIESVGKLITLDPATGLLNREQTELRVEIAASSETKQSLCLIYIAVRNYKLLCHQSGRAFAESAMSALGGRLRGIFGAESAIGRWSDDEVLVLLQGDPVLALSLSKMAALQIAGPYPVHSDTIVRTATLQTQVLFLERRTGESAKEVLRRIDAFALGRISRPAASV